jgi:hypothetical protein
MATPPTIRFSWLRKIYTRLHSECPVPWGLFKYVVMTFGLKNAGTTYQHAMNYIYHDLIGKLVEIYIDDVVVKSTSTGGTWRIYAKFLNEPGRSDSR